MTSDNSSQLGKDGKYYRALAERAIQAAASEAANSNEAEDIHFILPHVEAAITRFPENIWLKYYLAKLLHGLGRIDEGRGPAIDFARVKAREYWAWDLVGDLVQDDPELRLACYAKALCCSQDDDFVGKVRLKAAALLAEKYPAQARFEVERVLSHRARAGYRLPEEAQEMSRSAWFTSASPISTGKEFYSKFTERAEALLFAHLPWSEASLGSVFTIEGQEGRKPRRRRRIYIRDGLVAFELSLPASHPDIHGLSEGTPLNVQLDDGKAEKGRATIHRIRPRPDGVPMDVAPELIGVVDHVNQKRELLHVVAGRKIEGVCPVSALTGEAKPGTFVKVRLSKHFSRAGERTRIFHIEPTNETPSRDVCRQFRALVQITESGLGFTSNDIFIPPQLVAQSSMASGDTVEGLAVTSFDKKRGKWGFKAITAGAV